jgi:azurin
MTVLLSVLFAFSSLFTSALTPRLSSMSEMENSSDKIEIVIESNDQMRFNLSEITVKQGQTIVLTLKHVGKLPKAAMGHNWILLQPDTDLATFAMKAMKARDNEYVPVEAPEVVVNTILLGGGEETTIEFEAPAPGTYSFICSFPGHYALMQGTFIVE